MEKVEEKHNPRITESNNRVIAYENQLMCMPNNVWPHVRSYIYYRTTVTYTLTTPQ